MTIIQLLFLILDGRESVEEQGPGGCQEAVTIVNRDDSQLRQVGEGMSRCWVLSALPTLSIPFALHIFPLSFVTGQWSAYLASQYHAPFPVPSFSLLLYFLPLLFLAHIPLLFFFFISFVLIFSSFVCYSSLFQLYASLTQAAYSYSLMRLIFYPLREADEGSSLSNLSSLGNLKYSDLVFSVPQVCRTSSHCVPLTDPGQVSNDRSGSLGSYQ